MKRTIQVVVVLLIVTLLMAQQPVNIQSNATTEMTDGANILGTPAHPVQVSLANTATNATAVKVDGSGVTQPVSGTFWQATQPVSGTVTANAGTGTFPIGGTGSTGTLGQIICDKNFIVNAFSTSGSTQEVAASGSTKIYVCGFSVNSAATTAVSFKLVYGTGANCATSPADLSMAVPLLATATASPTGQNVTPPANVIWSTTASQALCVNLSSANAVNAQVWYTQF